MLEKLAQQYGLSEEEVQYVLEQGIEKVSGVRNVAKKVWKSPYGKAGIGLAGTGGLAYGGKRLLDRRRAAADELTAEDVEKTAAAYGLDPEEMEYLLEQGLEKVASSTDTMTRPFHAPVFTGESKHYERIGDYVPKKGLAKRFPGGKKGLVAAGLLGTGGLAYGGKRLLDRRRAAATEEDVEKTAAAYGLAPEEMEYLLEQGLEKVAFSTQDVKGRVVEMIQGARQKVPGGYAGMAGIGAAAAGAAYGGKKLLDRRRGQQDEEALFEMAEKTAAAYGLEPEEMEYLLERGLEKVSYELEG